MYFSKYGLKYFKQFCIYYLFLGVVNYYGYYLNIRITFFFQDTYFLLLVWPLFDNLNGKIVSNRLHIIPFGRTLNLTINHTFSNIIFCEQVHYFHIYILKHYSKGNWKSPNNVCERKLNSPYSHIHICIMCGTRKDNKFRQTFLHERERA